MTPLSPFTITLLQWFQENGRTLPWRETSDPYAIWLSEIILQQTRISQGTEYWHRFMQTYPTVQHLANASEDDVLRLWQGLGYYSRARNLHTAAKQIVELGHFPNTYEDIKKLKGVGDYTAAAVGSIAFNLPVAAVDGNVYRVLSRHFGINTPINTTEGKHTFAQLAQSLVPPHEAGIYNQAIMDFGAIQCTPQSPRCLLCPLNSTCQALHDDTIEQLPVKLRKITITTRHLSYVYIRCQGQIAIRRRGKGDIWQGLWEPYNATSLEENDTLSLAQLCHALSLPKEKCRPLLLKHNLKHVLTHRILYADGYLLDTPTRPTLPPEYQWIDEADITQYGVPRLIQLLFNDLPCANV